jgi:hypothetical protein
MSRKPLQWPRFHIYERRLNRLLFMLYSSSPGSEKSGIAFWNPLAACGAASEFFETPSVGEMSCWLCPLVDQETGLAHLLAPELTGRYGWTGASGFCRRERRSRFGPRSRIFRLVRTDND